jgi:hypothetical protein
MSTFENVIDFLNKFVRMEILELELRIPGLKIRPELTPLSPLSLEEKNNKSSFPNREIKSRNWRGSLSPSQGEPVEAMGGPIAYCCEKPFTLLYSMLQSLEVIPCY